MKKTLVIKVDPEKPDKKAISRAAKAIRSGRLVAFATETVYGLAANMLDRKAVDRLYEVKGRPADKPFTIHISDIGAMKAMGVKITPQARALIDRFWPGPLTVILKSVSGEKLGFRMPAGKVALGVIAAARVPVALPSANISGGPPPVSAESVLDSLGGKIDLLLDSGEAEIGVESTIADLTVTPPKILREGAIAIDVKKAIS